MLVDRLRLQEKRRLRLHIPQHSANHLYRDRNESAAPFLIFTGELLSSLSAILVYRGSSAAPQVLVALGVSGLRYSKGYLQCCGSKWIRIQGYVIGTVPYILKKML